jgi:catechol 2,3-dioxygenase-like lactoylglutathione lyase family enzyme
LSVDNHPKIPTLRAVDHCAYTVPDLDEAVQFFVDHFGAELVFTMVRS